MQKLLLALSLVLGLAATSCGQQAVYYSYPAVVYTPACQVTYTPVYYAQPVYYATPPVCYYQTVWPAWTGPRLVW